ncbi:hypothetical protein BGX28_006128 [Mortierella sp. GBA30]|nr:hypothetical protein BGX28_006128 [Mortierella sp. GBA30]
MPTDLFLYLLRFMSAGDLWRLCQVSRTMQREVLRFMSRSQRLEFEVVRILRQENPYTNSQMHRLTHQRHFEDLMDTHWISLSSQLRMNVPPAPSIPASSSPEAPELILSRGEMRSKYWEAQAKCLLTALLEGTHYARTITSANEGSELELEAEEDDEGDEITEPPFPLLSPQLFTSTSPPTPPPQAHIATPGGLDPPSLNDRSKPLPLSHFWTMVNVLFDPNLVLLKHRRALINCARYITSDIERSFGRAVKTHSPIDPELHTTLLKDFSVFTGPFLAIYSSHIVSPIITAGPPSAQDLPVSNWIQPSRYLESYFQMMLWHRCLTGLVTLYNRIQQQHTRSTNIYLRPDPSHTEASLLENKSHHLASSASVTTSAVNNRSDPISAYPFCCPAHSFAVASRRPYQLVPYGLSRRVRRAVYKFYCVSNKKVTPSRPTLRRRIEPIGPSAKLLFCTGSSKPPVTRSIRHHRMSTDAPTEFGAQRQLQRLQEEENNRKAKETEECRRQQEREAEEQDLLTRRFMMEERIRQDTLLKQELLSLCHTACGLFMIRGRRYHPTGPPSKTIMTLLRQGSPWNKGVWREGEWRHAPIDLNHDADEITVSRRLDKEIDYRLERGIQLNTNPDVAEGTIRERLNRLFNITMFYGKEAEDDVADQGTWQRLCLATIQFLVDERLAWGGNETNTELSKLRATNNATAWYYHE